MRQTTLFFLLTISIPLLVSCGSDSKSSPKPPETSEKTPKEPEIAPEEIEAAKKDIVDKENALLKYGLKFEEKGKRGFDHRTTLGSDAKSYEAAYLLDSFLKAAEVKDRLQDFKTAVDKYADMKAKNEKSLDIILDSKRNLANRAMTNLEEGLKKVDSADFQKIEDLLKDFLSKEDEIASKGLIFKVIFKEDALGSGFRLSSGDSVVVKIDPIILASDSTLKSASFIKSLEEISDIIRKLESLNYRDYYFFGSVYDSRAEAFKNTLYTLKYKN